MVCLIQQKQELDSTGLFTKKGTLHNNRDEGSGTKILSIGYRLLKKIKGTCCFKDIAEINRVII